MVEVAMLTPVVAMLLVGMTQIAQMTWLYYTLRKTVYSVGTYLSSQQGVNFCDPADTTVAAAINFGLTGTTDNSEPIFVQGLTADMIRVSGETWDAANDTMNPFACLGVGAPDYILVSIPNGYPVRPVIPFFSVIDTIALRPQVKVPYGGT